MTEQPLPPPGPAPAEVARLEQLAARRSGKSSSTKSSSTRSPSTRSPSARSPSTRSRRRHPAKGARVAALGLSLVASGGLGTALFLSDQPGAAVATAPSGLVVSGNSTLPGVSTPTPEPTVSSIQPDKSTTTSASVATTTRSPTTTVAAGPIVVNGEAFRNKWGTVQVQATFGSDGALVAVDAIEVPSRDSKSVTINNRAVPKLNQAALTAQSAQVDTVSGATYTSNGYEASLQAAIDIARANNVTQIT